MTDAIEATPASTCVVHIGFPKTGTSSLQGALAQARPQLARFGVIYPGTERQHKAAALGLMGAPGRRGDRAATIEDWTQLRREVKNASPHRVMVSSEWLCQATDAQARRAISDLGGSGVRVLATLRPLGKILPSAWQQAIQNESRAGYPSWLRRLLVSQPDDKQVKAFWGRHRYDEILTRWSTIVGPDNVTLIVIDEQDHGALFRQVEGLLALPAGTLVPEPAKKANLSLSRPEADLVRAVNKTFYEREWPDELYRDAIRDGVLSAFQAKRAQGRSLPSISTPQWALDLAAELDQEMAQTVRTLGVRIVGDLETLTLPLLAEPRAGTPGQVPVEVAADAVIAAIEGGQRYGRRQRRSALELATDFANSRPARQREWLRRVGLRARG